MSRGRLGGEHKALLVDLYARTHEAHMQVELAQLNYLLPRLTGRASQS